MVRILTIGDPHFKNDNFIDCDRLIKYTLELIDAQSPDYVCILGDLLHSHEKLYTEPLNKILKFIKQMAKSCPVYVLVGNHDMVDNSQFLTDNHWMTCMYKFNNVIVVDTPVELETDGGKFVFCPYVPNGRFEEALDRIEDWHQADCVFAHQEIKGCKMGSIISESGDVWEPHYPYIVSGHIHERQQPHPNVFYQGSALQHAFSSNDPKSLFIFEFHVEDGIEYPNRPGYFSRIEFPLCVTHKKTHNFSVESINKIKSVDRFRPLPEIDGSKPTMHKIVIKGYVEDIKAFKKSKKYKLLVETGAVIVFKAIHRKVENTLLIDDADSEQHDLLKLVDAMISKNCDPKDVKRIKQELNLFTQV